MILLKNGVTPRNLYIMAAVANVADELELLRPVVITAGTNGKHIPTSKHYTYEALDVRSKNFPTIADKHRFLDRVLARLGEGYQAFLEDEGTPNEHFHIEYDPKGVTRG
jgi:hypothetical protein